MKRVLLFGMLVFVLIVVVAGSGTALAQKKQAEKTTIEEILDNPGSWIDKYVEVTGTVARYVPETTASSSYYYLVSDYGRPIQVNTVRGNPGINRRITARGVVFPSSVGRGEPFISEHERSWVPSWPYWLIILVSALVLALIVLVVVYAFMKRSEHRRESRYDQVGDRVSGAGPMAGPARASYGAFDQQQDDMRTIRHHLDPLTCKLIGQLEIVSNGPDRGKSFAVCGYPGPNGAVVTIGRKEARTGQDNAHIWLKEYPTVSREQAELIMRGSRVFVKNKSTTNYTHCNGQPLEPEEECEIRDGDRFSMGELEMVFRSKIV